VVTEPAWLLWLELESSLPWLEPESALLESSLLWEELESSLLCVELELEPELEVSSLWLEVPLDDGVVVASVVLVTPPLPRAATASQAAMNVASVAAVMRRRTVCRRCLIGGSVGCGMRRIVAGFAQILLGASYGAGKSR
jgi:hypothetical protein